MKAVTDRSIMAVLAKSKSTGIVIRSYEKRGSYLCYAPSQPRCTLSRYLEEARRLRLLLPPDHNDSRLQLSFGRANGNSMLSHGRVP